MTLTNEQIIQKIENAITANSDSERLIYDALIVALTAIQNMDKKLAEEYERGCNDAWGLAVKVGGYAGSEYPENYTLSELKDIFGDPAIHSSVRIFSYYSYDEVVNKIKTYEEENKNKLVAGDEVLINGPIVYDCTGIFLYEDNESYWVIRKSRTYPPQKLLKRNNWILTKTGRHVELFMGEHSEYECDGNKKGD